MYQNNELKDFLDTTSVVRTQTAVLAEWNMNIATNISTIGNYRYRPTTPGSIYNTVPNTFIPEDKDIVNPFYYGATDADVVIDGGFQDNNFPVILTPSKDKVKMLYSLEDCFKPFRPRSGINKARFLTGSYLHNSNINMVRRPRYYMPDKNDGFKYWSSYRTENGIEHGVSSNNPISGRYIIEDAAPFVVYKNDVPTNRVVIKMQTNVGDFSINTSDPLYGDANRTVPVRWKVQSLKNNNWIDLISFSEASRRKDGTQIIKSDGYVELSYGLIVPDKYRDIFIYAEEFHSTNLLPVQSQPGYAYLILPSDDSLGTFHIWTGTDYETFTPTYGWQLQEETVDRLTNFVTDLTSPVQYTDPIDSKTKYREFDYITGLRIVVDNMVKANATFDLIELSPRLCVNLIDKVTDLSVKKSASDLGQSGLPVGQLLASTGSISLFDYDDAFNSENENSIIKNYLGNHIQVKIYDIVANVDGYDYFVPIKTLYTDSFPKVDNASKKVSLELRDLYFYLESITAPQMLFTNVSVSSAVCLLLDSVGFANYSFKRIDGETETLIPYFYIPPDTSVAQVLQDIAVSTQTAMFFDEYNNFIMMSRNYLIPDATARQTDIVLRGSSDSEDSGVVDNARTSSNLANIIQVTSQDNKVYNDGKITYENKYIQRSVGSIIQASLSDRERIYQYKPVLLWEVAGTEKLTSINHDVGKMSDYVLSAIPLNSTLSASMPTVSGNKLINNTFDLGEAAYWITRYNGYFYANGEIIKYDAVQYNISGVGNVWLSSSEEYEYYFAKLPFNGKMYQTGLVRIYTEPNYEVVNEVLRLKDGVVAKHGRGQFGTQVVNHEAGISSYWTDNNNIRGCTMKSEYLFDTLANITLTGLNSVGDVITIPTSAGVSVGQVLTLLSAQSGQLSSTATTSVQQIVDDTHIKVSVAPTVALVSATILFQKVMPTTTIGAAGINNELARKTTRNGIIKNIMSSKYIEDSEIRSMYSTGVGTVQSSALVMNGPGFTTSEKPLDFISYIYKPLDNKFKHFGTRMRIVGKIENNSVKQQSPVGAMTMYTIPGTTPDKNINIVGGSGGLGIMVNPETNNGYFLELVALGSNNFNSRNVKNVNNILFYKIEKSGSDAVPVPLWQGLSEINVDDGAFTGQYRQVNDTDIAVYDVAIEYIDQQSLRVFYIYINGNLIATVRDTKPLPAYNNMALFTRGASRLMFEHVYALANNYSQNTSFALDTPINSVFKDSEINMSDALRKYSMSGMIQSTYLSGIGSSQPPMFNMYFDEFGTIMREAALFNVKYDKAYPALYAKMSPTFNSIKGYTVSGFRAGSYGAEFLVFNATDSQLTLDSASGNYLRIQGVAFTQNSDTDLTVDAYYSKNSDFSDPEFAGTTLVSSPFKAKKDYADIKLSRITHGKRDFSLKVPYIQTGDDANNLMRWIVSKIMKPRKSVGVKIFSNPMIQLGDIVEIDYMENGIDKIDSAGKRFTVYSIDYGKSLQGPSMTLYLSEVS